MIIELAPHLEQIAVQKAQQQNMRTEDFISKLIEKNLVDEVPFNYDLERMKKAVEAPAVRVPDFDTDEEFLAWLNALNKKDFTEQV